MWLSRPILPRPPRAAARPGPVRGGPVARRTLLLTAAAALAGCGFTPVYGPGGAATGLRGQIRAADPDTREGYVFVAQLEDRLGLPAGSAPFALEYTISTTRKGLGVTKAGETTRYNLLGRLDYVLKAAGTGKVLTRGKVENFTGYSATGSIVGTISATEDATARLMVILADQLVTELIATAPDWRPGPDSGLDSAAPR